MDLKNDLISCIFLSTKELTTLSSSEVSPKDCLFRDPAYFPRTIFIDSLILAAALTHILTHTHDTYRSHWHCTVRLLAK